MRTVSFIFALLLTVSRPAFAQDWSEYQNIPDGFKIDFPGQPKITETTWTSEYGYKLPARVYTAERGKERYSIPTFFNLDYALHQLVGHSELQAQGSAPSGGSGGAGYHAPGHGY